MSEADTTLVGVNRAYRNEMVFSSSEPAPQSKPKMQNVIARSSDRLGSTDEETGEEFRHENCISDNESHDNIQTMEIESTSTMSRSLYRDIPTIVSILATYKLTAPLHSIMDCYFPPLEMEHTLQDY